MQNPLEQSVKSAIRQNDDIGTLFARVGTLAHPRGYVVSAYRQAARALKSAMSEEQALLAAADVMKELRRTIHSGTMSLFADAENQGADEAARQLSFYGISSRPNLSTTERTLAAVEAITARVDSQTASVSALILTDAEPTQIIDTLAASAVSGLASQFAANLVWQAFGDWVDGNSRGEVFKKQVIAGLDEKTTDCCLRAHAQIQPLSGKFELTGSPRFSDKKDWTPFHRYCRSSIALYQEEFDLGITESMRSGAKKIISERAAGGTGYRDPANAYA